ncbi:Putative Mg2+ transporter protein, CorA-like/Zinc transport protein ZntB [Septoria linicola]|uniref:Mg2+ transporter protein, CorA-like/Zinc transport protein ZntB n=1 Tax=Septoria linicola TaxID=215465 RepID=A0A9Q9AMD6_9PEZI|nr:Putative Mg2+ transporter protein, CorA-like/Zinc transport protein ZntB [Septoria linicola]
MSHRRRHHRRRPMLESDAGPILIRVGNSRSKIKFHEVEISGPGEKGLFARLVEDQVRSHPTDPLIVSVNGYQPWLGDVLHTCIEDYWTDIADLVRAVQYASTMQFPEKASKRGRWVPWTFIIDHMNVPQVYHWSCNREPPRWENDGRPTIQDFRFRTGVWFCGKGACRINRNVSVTIIFTKPTPVCENVVTKLLFDYLWRDNEFDQPREDEEGLCWTFSRLYYLLSDWQNIIGEVLTRLDEAEINSHGRQDSVKSRTRRMHREVDRIYEMKEYLHFHTRSFKKLQKLQGEVPPDEQKDPIWFDMDDAVDDLDQFDSTLDGLKERFNNLIELEFNITSATQSDNSGFLSAVATLFLPISFLASLFGMTTISWPAIWYVYLALPVFAVSAIFTAVFPFARKRVQKVAGPMEEKRLQLRPDHFSMLTDDYPNNVNMPSSDRQGRFKHHAKGVPGTPQVHRQRSRSKSQGRAWSKLRSDEKRY